MHDVALKLSGRIADAASSDAATDAAVLNAAALLPLVVRNLSFRAGGRSLIDALDLEITAPGVTTVMGPNGAGKSLLLRLLHGLIPPSAGEVLWAGMPPDREVQKQQAMVFQKPVLLRRSVADNMDFVMKLAGAPDVERRDSLLQEVGLLPLSAQPARLLSGGEQQRLSLARALATNPQVLLLDEPTASLDPASVMTIERIVKDASGRGIKIIFVTHDLAQAKRIADEVVFLHQGRVAEHAPAADFFERPTSSVACDYLAGRIVL
ncbi:MAG: ATP-binding cassette domain-containing protein [Alphaproteobacteria bacterium]|nr:ATP-binding cassette domain-containing protein [Alphaproteobacteria bacterium]